MKIRTIIMMIFLLVLLLSLGCINTTSAAVDFKPLDLRTHATFQSISIEWDIIGDYNHDATCSVRYRKNGTTWKDALPLFRIDWYGSYNYKFAEAAYNMFAGSILFLEPDTTYEIELNSADPDSGNFSRKFSIKTRKIPTLPTTGNTYHVEPGSGGGIGSSSDPFRGISEAQSAASPGDIFLIHSGNYSTKVTLNVSGEAENYIVWKAAGDGDANFGKITVMASHIWIEGLNLEYVDKLGSSGIYSEDGVITEDVIVSKNSITGFNYCINLKAESKEWYIVDNELTGSNSQSYVGEGVELNKSSGHVVAYNTITKVADGVSYPKKNCDIYCNDIFGVSDDGIEPDYGYANIRIWGNRIHNPENSGISIQPQYCGPWYIIRNQIVTNSSEVIKLRVPDRFLIAHNTFVSWKSIQSKVQMFMSGWVKNNLWICAGDLGEPDKCYWQANDCTEPQYCGENFYTPDWRTQMNNNGFDEIFTIRWDGVNFSLEELQEQVGIEKNSIVVSKSSIFETFNVSTTPSTVPAQYMTLKQGCNAVDAGEILPNINDDYSGTAPDLGAYETGVPLPQYGRR